MSTRTRVCECMCAIQYMNMHKQLFIEEYAQKIHLRMLGIFLTKFCVRKIEFQWKIMRNSSFFSNCVERHIH